MTLPLLLGRPSVAYVAGSDTLNVAIDGTEVAWTLRYVAGSDTLNVAIDGTVVAVVPLRLALTWTVECAFGVRPPTEPTPEQWVRVADTAAPRGSATANGIIELQLPDGRQSAEDDSRPLSAGAGTITLRNENGNLDPSNPNGVWAGQLVQGVPIRVRCSDGYDTYTWWSGYVDRWPVTWDQASSAATLDVVDWLGWLMQLLTEATQLHYEIAGAGPVLWWPMDEPSAGETLTERARGWVSTVLGKSSSGELDGFGTARATTWAYGSGSNAYVSAPASAMPRPPFSVGLIFRAAAEIVGLRLLDTGGATPGFEVAVTAAGAFTATVRDPTTSRSVSLPLNRDATYYAIITYAADGTLTADLGLGQIATATGSYLEPRDASAVRAGALAVAGVAEASAALGQVTVWASALSLAQRDALHLAHIAPPDGTRLPDRLHRLLDLVGWPSTRRALPTNSAAAAALAPVRLGARSLGELMSEPAVAEDGMVWTDGAGMVRAAVRSVVPAPTDLLFSEANVADMRLLAPAQVASSARTSGRVVSSYTRTDAPGGRRDVELPTGDMGHPVDAWGRAEREVWAASGARAYVDRVEIAPVRAGIARTVAGIGARVDVSRRPPWAAQPVIERSVIIGRELVSGDEADDERISYTLARARPERVRMSGLGGTTASWWSTPDSPAVSVRGEFAIVARVALDQWTTGLPRLDPIMRKLVGDYDLTFSFGWNTAGLELIVSAGPGSFGSLNASRLVFGDSRPRWVRGTYLPTGGATARMTLAWSWDAADWRTVADADVVWTGTPATVLADNEAPVTVGGDSRPGSPALGGWLHVARLYSGGAPGGTPGVLVAEFDPSRDLPGLGNALVSSTTGETWTRAAPATGDAGRLVRWA